MAVYLDLVFLLNFLLDGAVLILAAWARNLRVNVWRMLSASALGGGYAALMFIPSLSLLYTFAGKILISGVMILVAYSYRGFGAFVKNWCTFYFANVCIAGTVLALHYLLEPPRQTVGGIFFTDAGEANVSVRMGIAFLLFSFMIGVAFYRRMFVAGRQEVQRKSLLAEVELFIADRRFCCVGLIDTGNHLFDPLTQTPVMVMEKECLLSVLPGEWSRYLRKALEEESGFGCGEWAEEVPDGELQRRLRWIPYRGVNQKTGLLLAIRPDKVVIRQNERLVESKRVLIGLENGKLSADGTYQAIIHPALIA